MENDRKTAMVIITTVITDTKKVNVTSFATRSFTSCDFMKYK